MPDLSQTIAPTSQVHAQSVITCALNNADSNARAMLDVHTGRMLSDGWAICEPPVADFNHPLNWIAVLPGAEVDRPGFGVIVEGLEARVMPIERPGFPTAFCAFVSASAGAHARLTVHQPAATRAVSIFSAGIPARIADRLVEDAAGAETLKAAVADLLLAVPGQAALARVLAGLEPLLDTLEPLAAIDLLSACAQLVHKFGFNDAEAAIRGHCAMRQPNLRMRMHHAKARARAGDFAKAEAIVAQVAASAPDFVRHEHGKLIDELEGRHRIAEELRAIADEPPPLKSAVTARIAYCLHNALPYMSGGYAMRSHGLARALVAAGHDIIALVRPGFPSDSHLRTTDTVAARPIDGIDYRFDNAFGRRGRLYGYLAQAADYYAERFSAEGVGLVHAATNYLTALPAGIAARRLALPFVYEVRSFWGLAREAQSPDWATSREARRDDLLDTATLALADRVVTLTEAMRSHIAGRGVDADDIDLAPNCVDPDQWLPRPRDPATAAVFGIGEDNIVIGYVGSMVGYEGIVTLVEAAAPLIHADPRIRLLIVGADQAKRHTPGAVEQALVERIAALGLGERAVLAPRVARERVADVQTLIDVFAYPRLPLPVCELVSPLKPLEAMAMGKVVIASSVAGMRDMIRQDDTGLVYAKGDTGALTAGLARLVDDPALRARLGESARRFVTEERGWHRAAASVTQSYEQARRAHPERPALSVSTLSTTLDELFADL